MPGMPQARATDLHTCPATYGAPIPMPPGLPTVLVVKLPAIRSPADMCPGVSPHPVAKGSATVFIGKMMAVRVVMDPCAVGGIIAPMQVTVLTGG